MVDFTLVTDNSTDIYEQIKGTLMSGGKDGSYKYSTGPDAAGHNPGDNLTFVPNPFKWDFIFQGTHTTSGGYVDTLNFNIGRPDANGKSTLRIFSISNVHGSLGDNGQNYKNVVSLYGLILEGRARGNKIVSEGGPAPVHGCGAAA